MARRMFVRMKMLVFLLLAVGYVGLLAQQSYANTIPGNVHQGHFSSVNAGIVGNTSPSPYQAQHDAWHLMILSQHGLVQNVQVGMYFTNNTSDKSFYLNINTSNCQFLPFSYSGGTYDKSKDWIEIEINGTKIDKHISANNICNENVSELTTTIPSTSLSYDSSSGYYKATATVRWINDSDTGINGVRDKIATQGSVSGGGSYFEFRYKTDEPGAKIGAIGGYNTNNSLMTSGSSFGNIFYPFAMDCSQPTGIHNTYLKVYDIDNGISSQLGQPADFYIGYLDNSGDIVPLRQSAYTATPTNGVMQTGDAIIDPSSDDHGLTNVGGGLGEGDGRLVDPSGDDRATYHNTAGHNDDERFDFAGNNGNPAHGATRGMIDPAGNDVDNLGSGYNKTNLGAGAAKVYDPNNNTTYKTKRNGDVVSTSNSGDDWQDPTGDDWVDPSNDDYVDPSQDDYHLHTIQPNSGSGVTTTVYFNMDYSRKYVLVVRNVADGNFIYVAVPGDEINGAPDVARCPPPPPTSTCTATLSNYFLAPGQRARINYRVNTQNVSGAPSGSITQATASGGSIAQQGLTASGATLTGSAIYTAPSAPGTYTIDSGFFTSSPGTYNSDCPSFGNGTVSVGYMPYFSVVGGDIAAGSGFGDSCTTADGRSIKSWNADGSRGLDPNVSNDYRGAGTTTAALATDSISDFVSGLGLSGIPNGSKFGTGSTLSFTNTAANTNNTNLHGGHFDTLPCIHDFYGTKPANTNPVPWNMGSVSSLPPGSSRWGSGNGTLTLNPSGAATIGGAPGKTISLYVQGNVYIANNIIYSYNSLDSVPRFNLYVQGNISIAPWVTQLHGVYIAQKRSDGTGGNIVTCNDSTGNASESYTACKFPLTIYGAVAAEGKLSLLRTYGSLNGSGSVPFSPAEVVRYTPELWLGGATTVHAQSYSSLPPVL